MTPLSLRMSAICLVEDPAGTSTVTTSPEATWAGCSKSLGATFTAKAQTTTASASTTSSTPLRLFLPALDACAALPPLGALEAAAFCEPPPFLGALCLPDATWLSFRQTNPEAA